jgi:hypothetical protein
MNVREMEELALFLETVPRRRFNMRFWAATVTRFVGYNENVKVCLRDTEACGTACCIAGYQIVRKNGRCVKSGEVFDKKGFEVGFVEDLAGRELGLDYIQKRRLFFFGYWPLNKNGKPFHETPKGAAKRIRHMIETGE